MNSYEPRHHRSITTENENPRSAANHHLLAALWHHRQMPSSNRPYCKHCERGQLLATPATAINRIKYNSLTAMNLPKRLFCIAKRHKQPCSTARLTQSNGPYCMMTCRKSHDTLREYSSQLNVPSMLNKKIPLAHGIITGAFQRHRQLQCQPMQSPLFMPTKGYDWGSKRQLGLKTA